MQEIFEKNLKKSPPDIKKGGAPEKWNSSKIGRGERI
jgi:hypothetical protein